MKKKIKFNECFQICENVIAFLYLQFSGKIIITN